MSVARSTSVRTAWGLTPVRMTSAPRSLADAAGDGQERRRQLTQRFALRLDDLGLQPLPLLFGFTEVGDVGRYAANGVGLPARVEQGELGR